MLAAQWFKSADPCELANKIEPWIIRNEVDEVTRAAVLLSAYLQSAPDISEVEIKSVMKALARATQYSYFEAGKYNHVFNQYEKLGIINHNDILARPHCLPILSHATADDEPTKANYSRSVLSECLLQLTPINQRAANVVLNPAYC